MKIGFLSFLLVLVPLTAFAGSTGRYTLPRLNIDPKAITVSGFSSGAELAVQLHTAFSATFSGVGSFAGGPYWCAEGDMFRAMGTCMTSADDINPERSISKAKAEAKAGRIDPVANLAQSRVYIFAGSNDHVLNPLAGRKTAEYYAAFMSKSRIHFEGNIGAGHALPTLNFGNSCGSMARSPWAQDCGYDGVGEMLQHLYDGKLSAPVEANPAKQLFLFEQSAYASPDAVMARKGYFYVPKACMAGERCGLHVALHGCIEGPDWTDSFRLHSGYNEWAEANNIVILYPSVSSSVFSNPMGCWDWWGYTDRRDYVNKKGPQMQAIKAMVDQVAGL